MENPGSKTANFRFSHAGLISKESPDLLKSGQYRKLSNVCSTQEGALSSRTGSKLIGSLGAGLSPCNVVRKLVVTPNEDPLVPSTNPRYLDIGQNILRTYDYKTAVVVAANVEGVGKHWEMASYAAGATGQPFGFFACPKAMLKDSGVTPQSSLPTWGTPPSAGVAQAVCVPDATPKTLAPAIAIDDIYTNWPTWGGVVILLDSAPEDQTPSVPMLDDSTVKIAGVTGTFAVTTTDGRTDINDTWDIRVGVVDADGVTIDNPTTMFRLFDSNGQMVTGSGTITAAGTITQIGSPNGLAIGTLDGGADGSPASSIPYDYRWTGVSGLTGNEGNPSQVMASDASFDLGHDLGRSIGSPIPVHLGQVTVTVWGSPDADITTLNIYRRGGLNYDTWRFVGSVPNPGVTAGVPNPATFVDNIADTVQIYNDQIEIDNDMPVTSTVPVPYSSTISASGGSFDAGWMSVSLASLPSAYNLTVGTLAHIAATSGSEDCIIEAISGTTITVYFQYSHEDGDVITVDAIAGQPCNLTCNVGDAVLVFGDPNNPHILYKSKSGYPEAFPVGTDASGAVTNIGVGTPANGIVNGCEFRGQILSMNVSSLFEVPLISGSLLMPVKIAEKGLVAQSAWCKTETEVWFLSTDGIWSWDGGSLQKRTEAIDPIFHSMEVNGIPPISMQPNALLYARMEYRRGVIRLLYKDINNVMQELMCEPLYGDRWSLYPETYSPFSEISTIYTEPDTQSLILALDSPSLGATFVIADAVNIAAGADQTADGWVDPFSGGSAVPYDIWLPWFDLGLPNAKKLFEEIWLDVDPQLYTGTPASSMTVEILLDYSDTAVDSVAVTIPSGTSLTGRQPVALLANVVSKAAGLQSFGREARAISFHIYGTAYPAQATFYSLMFQYQETGLLTAGGTTDWMDLDHPFDKKLHQMTVTFDTEGTDRTIVLDTISGKDGDTYNEAVQTFVLSNPTILGAGRAKKSFPVTDGIIAKLVRVRPVATVGAVGQSSVAFFKIHSVDFQKETYPEDVTGFTPWEDGGLSYLKYANQVVLEVNTNGVAVECWLQADNVTKFKFTVISTEADRQRNITVPTGLTGYRWRLFVDLTQPALATREGMWQLFNRSLKFQQADKGEVGHTFDWDDLGHPFDKYLRDVTIEWDNTSGADVTLQLDTLSGINGQTLNTAVATFVLSGGRSKKEFPLPVDLIAKMIRLYPEGGTIPVGFKQWKYLFDKEDYPADVIYSTPWKDATSPKDKNPSWLYIDADTNSVPVAIVLQNENGSAFTCNHTGSSTNRKVNYPIPADVYGKMWRLLLTPGTGGKAQVFDWGFDRWAPTEQASGIDPVEVVLWTPWNDQGWPYQTIARNLILTINTNGVPCSVALQTEAGTVQMFPVNTTYDTRRLVLPCNSNLIGNMWRLLLTPGTGGWAQLWAWSMEAIKEPAFVDQWDSYEQGLGYKFWKLIKQGWWKYLCDSPLVLTITSDTGVFSVTLPAHATRAVERFYLPSVWGAGLNKSKTFRVLLQSASPFKFYAEGSGLEFLTLGSDRHAAYQQMTFSEMLTLGEG